MKWTHSPNIRLRNEPGHFAQRTGRTPKSVSSELNVTTHNHKHLGSQSEHKTGQN